MERTNHRVVAIIISVCAIVVLTCIMGWFVGRFVPGSPAVKKPAEGPGSTNVSWIASGNEYISYDIRAGDWLDLSGVMLSGDELDDDAAIQGGFHQFLGEDSWEILKNNELWQAKVPPSEIRVTNARAVSAESLEEWYQDREYLQQVLAYYDEYQTKFVVVDMELTNKSDEEFDLIFPWLWGDAIELPVVEENCAPEEAEDNRDEDFNDEFQCNSPLGVNMGVSLIKELYGELPNDSVSTQRHREDDWSLVPAGESCTYTLVYPVYRSMFESQREFDSIDLSQMYLQIPDCGTGTMYRLRLG